VARVQQQGAIVFAKVNMGEFAFSPFESVGSLFGIVRNVYDLTRTPAGMSSALSIHVKAADQAFS
jgi:amidase